MVNTWWVGERLGQKYSRGLDRDEDGDEKGAQISATLMKGVSFSLDVSKHFFLNIVIE